MSLSNTPPEFDYYTISRVLGEGGMGLVYLARDLRTSLPVAIKVISKRVFDPELKARFLEKSAILAALNHRNAIRCYEITQSREGTPSIVMEYVDGVDFRAFEGRPYPELLPLMIQALMGLSYLRSQNVFHRDLSSNNIFVTLESRKRVTKILDLGVSNILHRQDPDGDTKTQTGPFLPKPAFAAPELFLSSDIDWRSDVYSLGVIFHTLLTKKLPIAVARSTDYFEWLMAHRAEHRFAVEAPSDVPPLPEVLRDLVRQMLARDRNDRPQSYELIIDVLDRVQLARKPDLVPDPVTLQMLPPAIPSSLSTSLQRVSSPLPTQAAAQTPVSVEESQQRRWPDLENTIHTAAERSVPPPSLPSLPLPPSPVIPAARPSPASTTPGETPPAETPAFQTDPNPPKPSGEAFKTAPTQVPWEPALRSEVPIWRGGAAAGLPSEPVSSSADDLVQSKTERLDDVIAKLRKQAAMTPAPAPRPEAAPEPVPRSARSKVAPEPAAGRRLVVYGEPPPVIPQPPPAASPAARPAAPVPAADAAGRRMRWVGIGLIVAAIVVLFAAVLWFLISLLRGSALSGTPRSSLAGPSRVVVAAERGFIDPVV